MTLFCTKELPSEEVVQLGLLGGLGRDAWFGGLALLMRQQLSTRSGTSRCQEEIGVKKWEVEMLRSGYWEV